MIKILSHGLCCGVLIAGCSSSSPQTSSAGDGGKPASPTDLRQFESQAETMSNSLVPPTPNFAQGKGSYDGAVSLWSKLTPTLKGAGVAAVTMDAIGAALAAYTTDVGQQKAREAENDANQITLSVPDAFDYFTYPAPTDTLRLDGTFRQLQIDAEYSDWAGATQFLANTRTVWARLKPLVAARAPARPDITGAATVVADVDATLQSADAVIAAQDSAKLVKVAQDGLDQTDTCEVVFK